MWFWQEHACTLKKIARQRADRQGTCVKLPEDKQNIFCTDQRALTSGQL